VTKKRYFLQQGFGDGGIKSLTDSRTRNRTVAHADKISPVENSFKWRRQFCKQAGRVAETQFDLFTQSFSRPDLPQREYRRGTINSDVSKPQQWGRFEK
jgi:hypothetical protein